MKAILSSAAMLAAAVPIAIAATLLAHPRWRWVDTHAGIESYGHSGPAAWCYLLAYGLVVVAWGLVRTRFRTGRGGPGAS